MDHNINRSEYVQIFSLLSKAAQTIKPRESCVRLNTYGDPQDEYQPTYNYGGDNGSGYGYSDFQPEDPIPVKSAKPDKAQPKNNTNTTYGK